MKKVKASTCCNSPENKINERKRAKEQESKREGGRKKERKRERGFLKQLAFTRSGRSAAYLTWLLMIIFDDELVPSE